MRGRGIKYLVEGWVRQWIGKNGRRVKERERDIHIYIYIYIYICIYIYIYIYEGEGNKVFS